MKLNNEEIVYYAEGVSRFYFKKFGEINPKIIAYHNNITFSYNNYGSNFDGMLEFRKSKFHIYINTFGNEVFSLRANFTFGHELGHYYLPHHSFLITSGKLKAHLSEACYKSSDRIEKEADLFASSLLMPSFEISKIYSKFRRFDPKIFSLISKAFNVSPLAAIYRVLQLDLHPMMIIRSVSKRIDKITGRSKDFYFKLYSGNNLPEDSLASKFFESGDTTEMLKKLWIIDWFDIDSDKEMYEYCLYYPYQQTVYSVLWVD